VEFSLIETVNIVIGALIGTVLSVPVAVAISLWFARGSSRDLKAEAARLRTLVNALARHLHMGGVIKAEFDGAGDLMRFVTIELGGNQPRPTGELGVGANRERELSGNQPAATGDLQAVKNVPGQGRRPRRRRGQPQHNSAISRDQTPRL
jgi:hypothetical protein